MITGIEVKNYKMLDSIKVEGFLPINIFVGQNNCGKTSLLEAIFLNLNARSLFKNVNNIFFMRQLPLNQEKISCFFSFLDTNKTIQITSVFKDSQYIKLEISPEYNSQTHIISTNNEEFNPSPTQSKIIGLKSTAQNNNQEIKSKFVFQKNIAPNGVQNESISVTETDSPNAKEFAFNNLLVPSSINFVNVNNFIQKIRIDKQEKQLVQYLQIFDKNILGIEAIGNQTMIDLEDMPQKINIGVMGEGFKKYLFIVAGMLTHQFQYIYIDEIENGLHFKTAKKLIKSILELTKQTNIQLFITTHSLEFLQIFNSVTQEHDYTQMAIFNIAKTKKNGMQAYRYDNNGLQTLLENETEFRD